MPSAIFKSLFREKAKETADQPQSKVHTQPRKPLEIYTELDPTLTFSNLVVGKGNELANVAAYSVAEGDRSRFNPLLIVAPIGLGKTHFLHAIGNHIQANQPQLAVRYSNSRHLAGGIISGIRFRQLDQLQSQLKLPCDVLLIDGVDNFARGDVVQDSLIDLIEYRKTKRLLTVLTSQRPPSEVSGFKPELVDRLSSGFIGAIEPFDSDHRLAIMRFKAHNMGLTFPEDVLLHMDKTLGTSVRALEVRLRFLATMSEVLNRPIDMQFLTEVCRGT